jgi:VWFA-related protein
MRLCFGLALAFCVLAQEQQEPPILFRERVNLVTVPVVVRDRKGVAVGTLEQEDFQLFDKGKPQVISRFSVEKSSRVAAAEVEAAPKETGAAPPARPAAPERFIAYLFDDLHAGFGDLVRVRDAAWEHMSESLGEGDRAAIFTTSGQTQIDFTDDREQLSETLFKLSPRQMFSRTFQDCPDLSHYQAELIRNRMDQMAFQSAVAETMLCAQVPRRLAESLAQSAASRVLAVGEQGTRVALSTLRDVVKRMAAMPGQRIILLASPGFISNQENTTRNDIVDRAIKANVIINGLDARGLWVDSTFDASRSGFGGTNTQKMQIEREAQRVSSDIVADLAHGTGGKFFQNSNDLAGGFRKIADPPEYVYVLGFSPDNLKMDGSFHSLKVTVKSEERLTASARRGYYAPKQLTDPKDAAKEEIREALFSRQEARSVPLDLKAEGVRSSDGKPQLAFEMRIPISAFHYRLVDGRHTNKLTLAHAIFDRNGIWVAGEENTVDMKLQPQTLSMKDAAVKARRVYDLEPGVYALRVVIRDAEERNLTAANATVEVR